MEQEEAIDSLLCEAPSLIPTLSLSLPQASEGPAAATPVVNATAPAVSLTSACSNQGKGIKVSCVSRSEAFGIFKLVSDFPRVCSQIKEESILPQIKLEPHEVDQFLNLSPKGLECG